MITMSVTVDEEEMILNKRVKEERVSFAKTYRSKILKVSYGYQEWLDRYGRGSSFSTFVNEFGYQGRDATQAFSAVSRLLDTANNIAGIEGL